MQPTDPQYDLLWSNVAASSASYYDRRMRTPAMNTTPALLLLLLLAGTVLLPPPAAHALVLPKIFSSNMVIQSSGPSFYGWAAPGATVTVEVGADGSATDVDELLSASAGADGRWVADMQERPPSFDPLYVTISELAVDDPFTTAAEVTLHNVLPGSVWLCSGQSNMEFSVSEMIGSEEAMASSAIPGLRLFAVQVRAKESYL